MDDNTTFDFSQFMNPDDERWTSHLDNESERFPLDLESLLNRIIIYENPDVVGRVVTACLLAPSALSRNLPILFAIGLSGSGKSNLGKLAGFLYDVPVHGASSTWASIRNDLQRSKFHTGVEQNSILVLEDADPGVFAQRPDLFRSLKSGVSRSTSLITIAGQMGETVEFNCFGLKLISSITPLFARSEFHELQRRAYISPHRKLGELPDDFLDIDIIELSGLNDDFKRFWEDGAICSEYVTLRRSICRRAKSLKEKYGISGDQWIVSTDILAALCTCFSLDIKDACELLKSYFDEIQSWLDLKPQLFLLLREYLAEEEQRFDNNNLAIGVKPVDPFSVSAKEVKERALGWEKESFLDTRLNIKDIGEAMFELGYRLQKGRWTKQ